MHYCHHSMTQYHDGYHELCLHCHRLVPAVHFHPAPIVVEEVMVDAYGCPVVVEEVIVDGGYGYGGYPVVVEEVVVDPYCGGFDGGFDSGFGDW